MDYSGGELTIAWDLIEQTDAFTDAERECRSRDYLFQLAYLNRDAYYVYKCNDLRFDRDRLLQPAFHRGHVLAGPGSRLPGAKLPPDRRAAVCWQTSGDADAMRYRPAPGPDAVLLRRRCPRAR